MEKSMKKKTIFSYILLTEFILGMSGSLFAMQPDNQQPEDPAGAALWACMQSNLEIMQKLLNDWIAANLDNMIDAYPDQETFIDNIIQDIAGQGWGANLQSIQHILGEIRRRVVVVHNRAEHTARIRIAQNNANYNANYVEYTINSGRRLVVRHGLQEPGRMVRIMVTLIPNNGQESPARPAIQTVFLHDGGRRININGNYHQAGIEIPNCHPDLFHPEGNNVRRRNLFG